MKTYVFSILLTCWDNRNHRIFNSECINSCAGHTNMVSNTPNTSNYEKMTPNSVEWDAQIGTWKPATNYLEGALAPCGPKVSSNGPHDYQNDQQIASKTAKMVPKGAKRAFKMCQNHIKKTTVSFQKS